MAGGPCRTAHQPLHLCHAGECLVRCPIKCVASNYTVLVMSCDLFYMYRLSWIDSTILLCYSRTIILELKVQYIVYYCMCSIQVVKRHELHVYIFHKNVMQCTLYSYCLLTLFFFSLQRRYHQSYPTQDGSRWSICLPPRPRMIRGVLQAPPTR